MRYADSYHLEAIEGRPEQATQTSQSPRRRSQRPRRRSCARRCRPHHMSVEMLCECGPNRENAMPPTAR
eukprot:scaffold220784_cov32-Tisochrysis_lutea.AAC.13